MNAKVIYDGNDVDKTIPFTRAAYEHKTDDDYLPLPGRKVFVLYIQDEDGSVVRWAEGPFRKDLWHLAPAGCACWIVTEWVA